MSIKAYTFETRDSKNGQIVPFSAKVDARVKQDLFYGQGNLVIPGDRDGMITTDKKIKFKGTFPEISLTLNVSPSTVFMAGGRMFTLENENIPIDGIQLKKVNQSDRDTSLYIGTFSLSFDIDAVNASGEFVKLVSYPNYDTKPESWNTDKFSVTYDFNVVYEAFDSLRVGVFPAMWCNGRINAGGTFGLRNKSTDMDNSPSGYRGEMAFVGNNIHITKRGERFTISGISNNVNNVKNITIDKSSEKPIIRMARRVNTPDAIQITSGEVMLFTEGWSGSATIQESEKKEYLFDLVEFKTYFGKLPEDKDIQYLSIFGNFIGELTRRIDF